MAEEFDFAVRFSIGDIERLESIMEHLDMHEHDEAQALLEAHDLHLALPVLDSLLTKHSTLQKQQRLSELYTATFNNNVDDLEITHLKEEDKWRITGEGFDQNAFDFMACLILLLIASGAKDIQGAAQSDYWQAHWQQNEQGIINFNYKVYEGEE